MWPFRHLGLKLWSVALAAMLWMVVAGEQTVERSLRVPLELQQFPSGLELGADAPSLVDIRVRGSSGTLSRVGAGDIVAVLDLRTARPGRRLFQMTPEQIRVPFGVQVSQVSPASIALSFENSAMRIVPVVPALEGSTAPGFVVGTTTSDPPSVEVVGPESAIERVTEAVTEPVSVAGAVADVTDTVTVGFLDPVLRLRSPRQATVTVRVVPGPVERVLAGRPIGLKDLPKGLAARTIPALADVVFRGGRLGVNRVDADTIAAFVELGGLGPGEYTRVVHVNSTPDAGVARISPDSVQVIITRVK